MTYRILVVDDSTTIQKIFKIAFSRHDALIVAAGSLIEAVNEINREQPDLLVMDASLNGAKGPDDLRGIQADAGDVPVLLLVGSHEAFAEEGFQNVGMHHFLRKPFEAQDILRSVALVLGREIPLRNEGGDKVASYALSDEGHRDAGPPPPPIQSGNLSMPKDDLPPLPNSEKAQMAALGAQNDLPPPPPPNPERRGRKAFLDDEEPAGKDASSASTDDRNIAKSYSTDDATVRSNKKTAMPPPRLGQIDDDLEDVDLNAQIREQLAEFINGEAPVIVRKAIEAYCEKHFTEIAKAVLTAELRRLADEKARLLVDS